MRSSLILLAAGAALWPQSAEACAVMIGADPPPPRTRAERRAAREWAAQSRRNYVRQVLDRYAAAQAVIEVELLDDPHWPERSRARVLAVYKGDFAPGDEVRINLGAPTNCGNLFGQQPPRGTRGLLQVSEPGPEFDFPGFVPPNEIEMLRANHALPRPRR